MKLEQLHYDGVKAVIEGIHAGNGMAPEKAIELAEKVRRLARHQMLMNTVDADAAMSAQRDASFALNQAKDFMEDYDRGPRSQEEYEEWAAIPKHVLWACVRSIYASLRSAPEGEVIFATLF